MKKNSFLPALLPFRKPRMSAVHYQRRGLYEGDIRSAGNKKGLPH
ncbi:MAG: hypothetical protein PUH42_01095 [Firmicutes bacterium]|nr:hypothetical protein [Lentihominibacter sp.]MDD7319643.1 hypothetical protein [Bacillota bacterium]MDY5286996.1 hypothetical protein [Lentihominibacter sp.]